MTELVWRMAAALDPDVWHQRDYPMRNVLIAGSIYTATGVWRSLREIDCTNYSTMGDAMAVVLREYLGDRLLPEEGVDIPKHCGLYRACYDAAKAGYQAMVDEAIRDGVERTARAKRAA